MVFFRAWELDGQVVVGKRISEAIDDGVDGPPRCAAISANQASKGADGGASKVESVFRGIPSLGNDPGRHYDDGQQGRLP